ncbi:hypothetical protein F5Y18DRAFT_405551 [Xylariaceae sp. FL1019]|nr:hypothetical protein F5Y18DRAFT_405551 [Xylariaceae sp. FL1019]
MANKKSILNLNDCARRLLFRGLTDKQRLDLALINKHHFELLYPELLHDNLARHNEIVEGNVYALADNDGTCAFTHALDYADPVLLDKCLEAVDFWDVVAKDRATYNLKVSKLLQQCAFSGSTGCIPYLRLKLPNVFNQPFAQTIASLATLRPDTSPEVVRDAPDVDNDPAWAIRLCNQAAALLGHYDFEEAFVGKENVSEENSKARETAGDFQTIRSGSMALEFLPQAAYRYLADYCAAAWHDTCPYVDRFTPSAAFIETLVTRFGFGADREGEDEDKDEDEDDDSDEAPLLHLACSSLNVKAVYTLLRLGADPNAPFDYSGLENRTPLSLVFDHAMYDLNVCSWHDTLDRRVNYVCTWREAWFHTPMHNNSIVSPEYGYCLCGDFQPSRWVNWVIQIRAFCDRVFSIAKVLLSYGAQVCSVDFDFDWSVNWKRLPLKHPLHSLLVHADSILGHVDHDHDHRDLRRLPKGSHINDYDLRQYIGGLGEAFDMLVNADPRASVMELQPVSGSGVDRLCRVLGYYQPDKLRNIATEG